MFLSFLILSKNIYPVTASFRNVLNYLQKCAIYIYSPLVIAVMFSYYIGIGCNVYLKYFAKIYLFALFSEVISLLNQLINKSFS